MSYNWPKESGNTVEGSRRGQEQEKKPGYFHENLLARKLKNQTKGVMKEQ